MWEKKLLKPTSVVGASRDSLVHHVAATLRAKQSNPFEPVQLLYVAFRGLQTHVAHALVRVRDEMLHVLRERFLQANVFKISCHIMFPDKVEDLRHHELATSQNGWAEVWKKSRWIALDEEDWCEVLYGWLIIRAGTNTPSDEYDTYRDTGWRIRYTFSQRLN